MARISNCEKPSRLNKNHPDLLCLIIRAAGIPLAPHNTRPHIANMSLPPGFIEELRNRLSLSQVVGRKVTWDPKKSNAGKGDMWAPCPFHTEKTASFHVDDRKGFYYCFGCHEKGDAISFVRDTENVGFMEAIEILAREAGMTMPARDPAAQQQIDRNKVLADIMEQAVQYFKLQMNTASGENARNYINKRGLPHDIQGRFELGFAPNSRTGLYQHLISKGSKPEDIVDTGMAIKPDDGGTPYDRFRDRIMFPIRDARGRCIAFGGRAMDPNARAKYLNSPETTLFDKGRSLYHHGPAREASGKSNALIVAEGYMDVIALAQYGFNHAVAPLGTAITENQLAMLWRMHPEPTIALDGDTAGLRAALRLIDLALPLLEAGKSLRFCMLPQGQDPDDLLKASGATAMQDLLDNAQPMVNLLWQRAIEGKVFDSPERRAALDAELRSSIMQIKDKSLRSHYGAAIAELRRDLFSPKRQAVGFGDRRAPWGKTAPQSATQDTKQSPLARTSDDAVRYLRESVILAAAILNPRAAESHESALEKCPIGDSKLREIQICLLANLHHDLSDKKPPKTLQEIMTDALGFDPLERLRGLKTVRQHPYLTASAAPDKIARTLTEELDKHSALIGSNSEIKEAEHDIDGLVDEGLTWRLQQAAEARVRAVRADDETDNNPDEDAENLSQHLQNLLDSQVWVKKKR